MFLLIITGNIALNIRHMENFRKLGILNGKFHENTGILNRNAMLLITDVSIQQQ